MLTNKIFNASALFLFMFNPLKKERKRLWERLDKVFLAVSTEP